MHIRQNQIPEYCHTTILVHGFKLKLLDAGFNGAGGVKSLMEISGLGKVDCLGLTGIGGWPILVAQHYYSVLIITFAAYIPGT